MSLNTSVNTINSNSILDLSNSVYLVDASGGGLTVTLPLIASDGMHINIVRQDTSSNNVTINSIFPNYLILDTNTTVSNMLLTPLTTSRFHSMNNNWYVTLYSSLNPIGPLYFFTSNSVTGCSRDINSLTPLSITSPNIDIVLNTIGIGSLERNIPDGGITGGNCRGLVAVDLQKLRSNGSQVASGDASVISGGLANTAAGNSSTVSGGSGNKSLGDYSFIGGGTDSTSGSIYSTVSGGKNNNAYGESSFIGGGVDNISTGLSSLVSGGETNNSSGNYSTIGGGSNNNALAEYSTIGGGRSNTSAAVRSTIGGGENNNVSAEYSTISGGLNNIVSGVYTIIGGGQNNDASSESSTISGGAANVATGIYSTISGGIKNNAGGYATTIAGGQKNITKADYSAALGGQNLFLSFPHSSAVGRYNEDGTFDGSERLFMVGYSDDTTPTIRRNLFSITTDGNAHILGKLYTTGGADFAEFFESISGESIPIGTPVIFDKNSIKIRPATFEDNPFGVITNTAAFIGNSAGDEWVGKYVKNEEGSYILDKYEVTEDIPVIIDKEIITNKEVFDFEKSPPQINIIEEKTIIKVPDMIDVMFVNDKNEKVIRKIPKTEKITKILTKKRISPNYDHTIKYIPRISRKEWNIVGLLGLVKIIRGSPINNNWIKIDEYNEKYETWFIK